MKWNQIGKQMWNRLRNPTVLMSVLTQGLALLILMGVKIDEDVAMTGIGLVISILASLGIVRSSRNSVKPLVETAELTCSGCGGDEVHVMVNGQMVCATCGAVFVTEGAELEESAAASPGEGTA